MRVAHPSRAKLSIAEGAPLLELQDVKVSYGGIKALRGISLRVFPGEIVAMIGANGAGKTTTLKTIMGLLPLASGAMKLAGRSLAEDATEKRVADGISLVPEGRAIFPNLTVRENLVAAAADRFDSLNPWTLASIYVLFPRLAERAANMGNQLSGGEQQMLAIGRALMTNPKLLILDEATEGLAPLIREEIWSCLSLLKSRGQSILVVDKNVDHLARICDRHYIIERGKTVWSGSSDELMAEPDLQHKYLGI